MQADLNLIYSTIIEVYDQISTLSALRSFLTRAYYFLVILKSIGLHGIQWSCNFELNLTSQDTQDGWSSKPALKRFLISHTIKMMDVQGFLIISLLGLLDLTPGMSILYQGMWHGTGWECLMFMLAVYLICSCDASVVEKVVPFWSFLYPDIVDLSQCFLHDNNVWQKEWLLW